MSDLPTDPNVPPAARPVPPAVSPADPDPVAAATPAAPPAPPAAQPPAAPTPRLLRVPVIVGMLVPLLVIAAFLGGIGMDRAGLLPGSPNAPVASPAPIPPATPDPNATPGPTLAPGETPVATFPPGVTGIGLIEEAWETLHREYILAGELDDRAMAYAAIRAMTEAVGDEGHTQFFTPEELAALEQSLSGEFVGIGVEVDTSDGIFRIADVIPDTPAEEGGLRRGDVIVAADGVDLIGLSEEEAFSRIRGPAGTPVVLTIKRDALDPFDVLLVRRAFDLPLVSWTMVPGTTTAFIRLESFSSGAGDAVKDALRAADEAGATNVLFDLRGNPGGYVNEAVAVASQFIPDGVVYVTRNRDGGEEPSMVEEGGLWTDRPVVVLVDGNTASSAEIVSSAIQDAGRGEIIGEQTFGTGTVLGRFDLADGSSLRIGTVLWLTRDGRPLWGEGLTPDQVVELDPEAPRLRPRDVEGLTPAQVWEAEDTQVVQGLEELDTAGG